MHIKSKSILVVHYQSEKTVSIIITHHLLLYWNMPHRCQKYYELYWLRCHFIPKFHDFKDFFIPNFEEMIEFQNLVQDRVSATG